MEASGLGGAPAGVDGAPGGEGGQQDQGGAPQGLYDKYLPPEYPETHDVLRNVLHKFNSEVAKPKLDEYAEFRKKFERFDGVDLPDDLDGESLKSLVDFASMDENDFRDWYRSAATQLAQDDPEGFEALFNEIGQELGYFEDEEGEEGNEQVGQLQQQVQQLSETLNGFLGQQQQSERQSAADKALDAELQELAQAHNKGDAFPEEFEEALYRMGTSYSDQDKPLHAAFQQLQALNGQAQSELVESKLDQPRPANGNGNADTRPEGFHKIEDARSAARARLAAAHATP
jgi:hypothetical protein